MTATGKHQSLDLRVTPRQKEIIRRAAAARGQTMTDFIMAVVEPVAAAVVERESRIELSEAAWREFVQMAEGDTRAAPLARQEARVFLAELSEREG